jgi:hypothetical protein
MEPRPSTKTINYLRIPITDPRPLTDQLTNLQNLYEMKIFHEADTDNQWVAVFLFQ